MSDDNDVRDDTAGMDDELDDSWEVIRTVGTEEEASVVVGFLNSSDIPAAAESLHIRELPVDFGQMSQVRIRVPVERAEEAKALLAAQDVAAPLSENEPVDVAPGSSEPDPSS
ncbi:MAG TPA: hypothetical protein VOA87_06245 [Thermoanaerobaculia bacterium]|nr:hypothetical protein [Thermoanaerobaculia bacterium]